MPSLPLPSQVQFHIVRISHWTVLLLILLSPHSEWHVGNGNCSQFVILCTCRSTFLNFLPLLQHGVPHEGYSLLWTPWHGQQFCNDCSSAGPLHGVQTARNALLQQRSAMGCSSCQHLLLHWVSTVCSFLQWISACCDLGPSTGGSLLPHAPTGAQLWQRKHNIKGAREEPLLEGNRLYLLIVSSSCVKGLPCNMLYRVLSSLASQSCIGVWIHGSHKNWKNNKIKAEESKGLELASTHTFLSGDWEHPAP